MDASRNDSSHEDAEQHAGLQRGATINIQVALLGGQTLSIETQLSATVSDIKAAIHFQLGHHAQIKFQKLILDTTILADSSALLKDVGVNDGSLLTVMLFDEPLGQDLLREPDGEMEELSLRGEPNEVLNEFQLMSLQAAWSSSDNCFIGPDEGCSAWGNLGHWSIDLYWTTRSNKCRYEYWSTDPGDNENGALIRIDVDSITCIGEGSDDGLRVFRNFQNDPVARELVHEGWPRFQASQEWTALVFRERVMSE
jgi:hypothetical protein